MVVEGEGGGVDALATPELARTTGASVGPAPLFLPPSPRQSPPPPFRGGGRRGSRTPNVDAPTAEPSATADAVAVPSVEAVVPAAQSALGLGGRDSLSPASPASLHNPEEDSVASVPPDTLAAVAQSAQGTLPAPAAPKAPKDDGAPSAGGGAGGGAGDGELQGTAVIQEAGSPPGPAPTLPPPAPELPSVVQAPGARGGVLAPTGLPPALSVLPQVPKAGPSLGRPVADLCTLMTCDLPPPNWWNAGGSGSGRRRGGGAPAPTS